MMLSRVVFVHSTGAADAHDAPMLNDAGSLVALMLGGFLRSTGAGDAHDAMSVVVPLVQGRIPLQQRGG